MKSIEEEHPTKMSLKRVKAAWIETVQKLSPSFPIHNSRTTAVAGGIAVGIKTAELFHFYPPSVSLESAILPVVVIGLLADLAIFNIRIYHWGRNARREHLKTLVEETNTPFRN